MKVKITGDREFIRMLLEASGEVLEACREVVEQTSAAALSASHAHVPRDTGNLARSTYRDPTRMHNQSVSSSVGYEHQFAAQIHEGWTYGLRGPAPRFLRKGANSVRRAFVSRVESTVRNVLRRIFG
jgi:hypothetical protein